MIKLIEGDKKHIYSIEDYRKEISEAKKVSDSALLHFFDLINLRRDLFNHLTKIDLVVDLDSSNDYDSMIAFYENINYDDHSLDNTIHFLPEYLDSIIKRNNVVCKNDLVRTIIHETIHANRSIIINNGVLYPEYHIASISEYESYRKKFGHLIKKSNLKFQVLKWYKYSNINTIYAYNHISGDFFIFTLPDYFVGSINSIDVLNDLINNNFDLFELVYQVENPYDLNYSSLVSSYSTSFKNPMVINKKNSLNVDLEVEKQTDFEESITEAFSQIIFYLRDKDQYNIDELLNNKRLLPNVRLALQFINSLDMDTIRWFFLSCYQEEYVNKFYEMYKDDYFRLIDLFSEAFQKSMSEEEYTNYDKCLSLINKLKK